MRAVTDGGLGHALAAGGRAGEDRCGSTTGHAQIDLVGAGKGGLAAALQGGRWPPKPPTPDLDRIVQGPRPYNGPQGRRTVRGGADVVYFTGGSTGLYLLVDRIAAGFPSAAQGPGRPFRQRHSGARGVRGGVVWGASLEDHRPRSAALLGITIGGGLGSWQ